MQVPVLISEHILLCLSYQKMIARDYLGKIVCLALKDLINKKALFQGKMSEKFDSLRAFSIARLSIIEGGYVLPNWL